MSDREALARAMSGDHCHGIVTRDGEQDACGKPAVAIIDGRGTEDETYWPACAYHAHRYGHGNCVPLGRLLADVEAKAEARGRREVREDGLLLDAAALDRLRAALTTALAGCVLLGVYLTAGSLR